MDLPGGADPEEHDGLDRVDEVDLAALWPLVLVPEPAPWPRSFGWFADGEDGRALLVWYPGEPADVELALLGQLSPRIEVEMRRATAADVPGSPVDVLLGEQRLPGVLAPSAHGWSATLLVPGDHVDDRGDLAVTVRAAGAPAPTELRLRVRPSAPLVDGRRRVLGRLAGFSR